MKKVLFALLFLTLFGIYRVDAQTKYSVTVYVQITYEYYDDENYLNQAFESSTEGTPQTIVVCADTPEEAKSEAKDECDKMCSRNYGRKLGRETKNGKTYYVMEYRKVSDASVKAIGSC